MGGDRRERGFDRIIGRNVLSEMSLSRAIINYCHENKRSDLQSPAWGDGEQDEKRRKGGKGISWEEEEEGGSLSCRAEIVNASLH